MQGRRTQQEVFALHAAAEEVERLRRQERRLAAALPIETQVAG